MIAKAIEDAIEALQVLQKVLGYKEQEGFAGEHFKLTPQLIQVESAPIESHPKAKKRRAKLAMMKAIDPNVWPYERNGVIHREPSDMIQKELRAILRSAKSGVSRGDIFKHIGHLVPPKYKKDKNRNGYAKWQSSLGNILRNYSATGYIDVKRKPGVDRSIDIFTIA